MTEKRFIETISTGIIKDNQTGIEYPCEMRIDEDFLNLVNTIAEENKQLKSENETYKNMFFEIVETALTDKNCRGLYCKGILDIFDKANSLNQAREMIKEHLK